MGLIDPRHLSVRELISAIYHTGDLETESYSNRRAVDGTKGHKIVQQSRPSDYEKEVKITGEFLSQNLKLVIEGRMDGIYPLGESRKTVLIEEIKTVKTHFPENWDKSPHEHKLQLLSYVYLYCIENNLKKAEARLTYYNLNNGSEKTFDRTVSIEEASEILLGMTSSYFFLWAESVERNSVRNESIRNMEFPYGDFRGPQREMSVAVYRSIREKKDLMVEAPTGTGKTMGALFPAIKALGENEGDRIFYVTARTPGRLAAEEAFRTLIDGELKCRAVSITAKQKICFNPGSKCSASECSYAESYYNKLPMVLEDLDVSALYNREKIEGLARDHHLCPFELSLDVSLMSDVLICDYNYVFDPLVKLKRYFMKPVEDYILLTDEAHNLPDRSRDMFSAYIDKEKILSVRREIKSDFPQIAKKLNRINQLLLDELKTLKEGNKQWNEQKILPDGLRKSIGIFLEEAGAGETNQTILDLTFELRRFYRISEMIDNEHTVLLKRRGNSGLKLTILNLDPSKLLKLSFKQFRSSILFSATLIPSDYFIKILFNDEEIPFLSLPSPFPDENCEVCIRTDVETRYNKRAQSIDPLCEIIHETIKAKEGNYLVFFPSYSYMNSVREQFEIIYPSQLIHIQESGMNEEERTDFLTKFSSDQKTAVLAFAVMGGIFGEGIDLRGDKLIGTMIVGPGLPGISVERDLYKKYYEENGSNGFNYAYKLPGFNKVLQAAGRVIRSENDRGIILLIDNRYGWSDNKRLYPLYWKNIHFCNNTEKMIDHMNKFWRGKIHEN